MNFRLVFQILVLGGLIFLPSCVAIGYGVVYSRAYIQSFFESDVNSYDMSRILNEEAGNYVALCSICESNNMFINIINYEKNVENALKKISPKIREYVELNGNKIKFISFVETFSSISNRVDQKLWGAGPRDAWIIFYDETKNIIGSLKIQMSDIDMPYAEYRVLLQ